MGGPELICESVKILTTSLKNVHEPYLVCLHIPYKIVGRLQLTLYAKHLAEHWRLEVTQQLFDNSVFLFCSFYKRKLIHSPVCSRFLLLIICVYLQLFHTCHTHAVFSLSRCSLPPNAQDERKSPSTHFLTNVRGGALMGLLKGIEKIYVKCLALDITGD